MDRQLVSSREPGVGGDELAAMEDGHRLLPTLHFDGLTDQHEGHGVAVRIEADEVIGCHDTGQPCVG